jgi:hypothetical protein
VTQSHSPQPPWREIYQDGSEQAEQDHFRELADRIVGVQRENERKSGSPAARRTFHAKIVVGMDNAELAFPADLPAGLSAGDFTPGARLPAMVRLSNASGSIRPDSSPDLRGAALKVTLPGGAEHDLLMTSYPVSHARNADQFVEVAQIGVGPEDQVLPRMLAAFGQPETGPHSRQPQAGQPPVRQPRTGVLLEPRGRPVGRRRPRPIPPQPPHRFTSAREGRCNG